MIKNISAKFKYYILPSLIQCMLHIIAIVMLLLFSSTIVLTYFLTINVNIIEENLDNIVGDNTMYRMMDNYVDDDSFTNFGDDPNDVNKLALFYNAFMDSEKITILSVFTQPLHFNANEFSGDKRFNYNSDEFLESVDLGGIINIKSIQINEKAYNFYNLQLEKDGKIDWENVDYQNSNSIPIVLGSSYKDFYNIGDTIKAEFYFKDMSFHVTGFLKENSHIYYNGSPEFYIDDYIMVLYPGKLWEVNHPSDYFFEKILYFAMINCDLVTTEDHEVFINEIKKISDQSEFSGFSIISNTNFMTKYNSLITLLHNNKILLCVLMVCLYIVFHLSLYGLAYIIICAKIDRYKGLWVLGSRRFKKTISIKLFFGFLTSIFISVLLPKLYFRSFNINRIMLFIVIEMIAFYLVYKLLVKRISKHVKGY